MNINPTLNHTCFLESFSLSRAIHFPLKFSSWVLDIPFDHKFNKENAFREIADEDFS